MIPRSRIPDEVVEAELARVREALPHVNLRQRLERSDIEELREEFDFIVIASGAQKPRVLPIPGKEKMIRPWSSSARARRARRKWESAC